MHPNVHSVGVGEWAAMGSRAMTAYLTVAIGGAIGTVLRYYSYTLFGARPLTTFGVNILGSFAIGVLAAATNNPHMRVFFGTGLLGGFTTFSAWQLEALQASHNKANTVESITILLGSLTVGFIACWMGFLIGQRLGK